MCIMNIIYYLYIILTCLVENQNLSIEWKLEKFALWFCFISLLSCISYIGYRYHNSRCIEKLFYVKPTNNYIIYNLHNMFFMGYNKFKI